MGNDAGAENAIARIVGIAEATTNLRALHPRTDRFPSLFLELAARSQLPP
jgi:hypothetical protein